MGAQSKFSQSFSHLHVDGVDLARPPTTLHIHHGFEQSYEAVEQVLLARLDVQRVPWHTHVGDLVRNDHSLLKSLQASRHEPLKEVGEEGLLVWLVNLGQGCEER